MKRVILFVVLGMSALSACKKTKTVDTIDFLLTSKSWKPVATDVNPGTNPKAAAGGMANLYAAVKSCNNDDTYTFGAGEILTIHKGKTKCEPNEPETVTVSYSYDKAGSTITIDNVAYKVVELNDTQLKYYAVVPGVSGTQNVIYIYQH